MKSLFLRSVLDENTLYENHVIFRQKNFQYALVQKSGIIAVVLIDEDDGKISLTNAMEEVIELVVEELLVLKKISLNNLDKIRFFAYGTDELFSEPRVSLEKIAKINRKESIKCSVNRWEYIEDSDASWKMVFLLG